MKPSLKIATLLSLAFLSLGESANAAITAPTQNPVNRIQMEIETLPEATTSEDGYLTADADSDRDYNYDTDRGRASTRRRARSNTLA
ncbi:hypothetical protein [Lyngbya sp. CCY1209]|uniref:hypothetical protein n=1 Tax=Lyngbya sp. CCY1209 TaxID=2886103 RepID=UPI002D1FDE17|nr:hypothetical protein [Lyngbya sp. CCY1209]MEB3887017.1 hypothetical protein [Lyngbya sp. CCY1209]